MLEFDSDVYMLSTSDDMNIEDEGDAEDGEEALMLIRKLMSYIPQNNLEETPLAACDDPIDRVADERASCQGCRRTGDHHGDASRPRRRHQLSPVAGRGRHRRR